MEGGRGAGTAFEHGGGRSAHRSQRYDPPIFPSPLFGTFSQGLSPYQVKVTNAPTPETIESLEESRIDFGVVTTPFEAKMDEEKRSVFHTHPVCCRGQLWSAEGRELDYGELEQFPCIFLEKNTSTRAFMDSFLESRGVF